MWARFLAWPHVQPPGWGFPKLEAQKREALFHRSKPTLLLVHPYKIGRDQDRRTAYNGIGFQDC
jgi:hypothetical protein